MLFKQDLGHSDEGGDSFQQRVCILFRGFDRPTILVSMDLSYTRRYEKIREQKWKNYGSVTTWS